MLNNSLFVNIYDEKNVAVILINPISSYHYPLLENLHLDLFFSEMAAGEQNIGHLEDAALRRRERLKDLKRKREGRKEGESEASEEPGGVVLPKPTFRSYRPGNEELSEFVKEPSAPGDVTAEVKAQLEAAKSGVVIDQLDVTALAPRKPDWDLKRDVAKKLAKLERQTQRAIAELIRDRLKERSKTDDLAALVNAGVGDQAEPSS